METPHAPWTTRLQLVSALRHLETPCIPFFHPPFSINLGHYGRYGRSQGRVDQSDQAVELIKRKP